MKGGGGEGGGEEGEVAPLEGYAVIMAPQDCGRGCLCVRLCVCCNRRLYSWLIFLIFPTFSGAQSVFDAVLGDGVVAVPTYNGKQISLVNLGVHTSGLEKARTSRLLSTQCFY